MPCKLWGFANLSGLPVNTGLNHGQVNLCSGHFAVAECAVYVNSEGASAGKGSTFRPIRAEAGGLTHNIVAHLKFYLIGVEAFHGPVAVVPDLGGSPNDYLLIKPRTVWREEFIEWLITGNPSEEIVEENGTSGAISQDNYLFNTESSDSGTDYEEQLKCLILFFAI